MARLRFGQRSVPVTRGADDKRAAADARRSARAGTAAESGNEQNTIPPLRDIEGAPETPLELGETGWWHVIKRAGKEFTTDRCTMTAAAWRTTGSWPFSRRSSPCSA